MKFMNTKLYCTILALVGSLMPHATMATSENEAVLAKYFQKVSKECEEYSLILAEVRVRKIDKALRAKGLSITDEQRFSVYSVTKDQCVSVKLVGVLREIRAATPDAAWSKTPGESHINDLLARIERTLDSIP